MIEKVLLPKLGQTMEEATIAAWRKAEGDEVRRGEVICEITTDKATLEVESYAAGFLRKILAPEGAAVAVNETIAVVAGRDETIPAELLDYRPKAAVKAAAASSPATPSPAAETASRRAAPPPAPTLAAATSAPRADSPPPYEVPFAPMAGARLAISPRARRLAAERGLGWRFLVGSGPGGRIRERDVLAYERDLAGVRATPAARRLAAERHVDLRGLASTGPGGRVCEDDVAKAPPSLPAGGFERRELTAMRRVIAERMSWSAASIPQFSLGVDVDMSAAGALRQRLADGGAKVSYTVMIAKAAALAMRGHPEVASLFDSGTVIMRGNLNVGVAVALEEGLIVPVLRNADGKTLAALNEEMNDLVGRARTNRLTPDEYTGGVLTISNLGMLGVGEFRAIVNPGESAILACGRVVETPVAADGGVVVRPILKLTGSFDHRAVDGAQGARFLASVKGLLEGPEGLLGA